MQLRVGRVTASELTELVDSKFEPRTGEKPKTYLYQKVAEVWRGKPLDSFSSWESEEGQLREEEARRWFALEYASLRLSNVGFVEHDDGLCGCSPDGLLGDTGGLELKCPQSTNHVRYSLEGVLPISYAPQVHMSMYVTGRPWWFFVSYCRKFPTFVLKVERDEAICAKIAEAVATFTEKLNTALAKLRNT